MNFLTKLTFWDGVEMTAFAMIALFSITLCIWELRFSPSAQRERQRKNDLKET